MTVSETGIAGDDAFEVYLKHRAMILNAGALAQAFDGRTVDEYRLQSIRIDNAKDDNGKAGELFALYLNRRIGQGHDKEYRSRKQWMKHPFWQACEHAATEIVRENWHAIDRIVAEAEQAFKTSDTFWRPAAALDVIGWGWGRLRGGVIFAA